MARPNVTINFLAGVDDIKYYNSLNGATNMIEFLQFFEEASNAADIITGRPALEGDDMIMVDNVPAHHGEEGRKSFEGVFGRNVDRTCLSAGLFPIPEYSGGSIFKTETPAEIQISMHCSLES